VLNGILTGSALNLVTTPVGLSITKAVYRDNKITDPSPRIVFGMRYFVITSLDLLALLV